MDAGQLAPDIELLDEDGKTVRLSDFAGEVVLIYFYPKDDTPGCTAQACAIRDSWEEFSQYNVLGISADSVESHREFKDRYSLPFTLLADTELAATEAFGVVRPDPPRPERATFVIDPDGRVALVMRNVDPATHADYVLQKLREVSAAAQH